MFCKAHPALKWKPITEQETNRRLGDVLTTDYPRVL